MSEELKVMPLDVEKTIDPEVKELLTDKQLASLEEVFGNATEQQKGEILRVAQEMATGTEDVAIAIENYRRDRKEALSKNETEEKKYSANKDGTVKFEK